MFYIISTIANYYDLKHNQLNIKSIKLYDVGDTCNLTNDYSIRSYRRLRLDYIRTRERKYITKSPNLVTLS